jgi:acyl-homoserine lactone acylase PvdQ
MVLELLDSTKDVSLEQAIAIAFSPAVYKAGTWQGRIRESCGKAEVPACREFARLLTDWNRGAAADSRGALAFYLFKIALGVDGKAVAPPASIDDAQIRAALEKAEERLKADFAPDATFGTFFRIGREGAASTFPVGGGTLTGAGMATPRAVSFESRGKEMLGRGGQTSTQIVLLTKPPRSFMVIPLGESDHKESPHFDDQAKNLFSRSLMKPTYFLDRKGLAKHVERVERLRYPE